MNAVTRKWLWLVILFLGGTTIGIFAGYYLKVAFM